MTPTPLATAAEAWDALVKAWHPEDWYQLATLSPSEVEGLRHQYAQMFSVAQKLQPKTILEIGVRAGYSAFTMLSAVPGAMYYGWDADRGDYGGSTGYLDFAEQVLKPFPRVCLEQIDSQAERTIPPVDLAHIDGDHSYEGCYHDLELCATGARHILVDDYEYIRPVQAATDHWLVKNAAKGIKGFAPIHHGGFRSAMLIQVR